jgi:hypothetical protein
MQLNWIEDSGSHFLELYNVFSLSDTFDLGEHLNTIDFNQQTFMYENYCLLKSQYETETSL